MTRTNREVYFFLLFATQAKRSQPQINQIQQMITRAVVQLVGIVFVMRTHKQRRLVASYLDQNWEQHGQRKAGSTLKSYRTVSHPIECGFPSGIIR